MATGQPAPTVKVVTFISGAELAAKLTAIPMALMLAEAVAVMSNYAAAKALTMKVATLGLKAAMLLTLTLLPQAILDLWKSPAAM